MLDVAIMAAIEVFKEIINRGHMGVSWCNTNKKWVVSIVSRYGKKIGLGYYSDVDLAISARKIAEIEHGYHKNHGGFI